MSTTAKTVSVTAQVGNVSIPVSSITLRHAINALPVVEFTTQLSNKGPKGNTGISLATFLKLNRLVQEKFYNNFSIVPDTTIQVVDGDQNTITFNGFLMQPQLRIIAGQLSIAFSAIHVGAAFQAFNGSVYNTQAVYLASTFGRYFAGLDTEEVGPAGLLSQLENLPTINASEQDWENYMEDSNQDYTLFTDPAPPRTDSIAQRISAIVQGLHASALENTANQNLEIQGILNVSVLNANTAVLPYIVHFLMGSLRTTIISGLTAFGSDPSDAIPSDSPLLQTIFDILTDSPNFLASVLNYINPFLFQLNASWSGQLALEPNQFIAPPGKRIIKAPIEDAMFSLASTHDLPLAQVIVLYPTEEFYAYGGNMGTDQVPLDLLGAALSANPGIEVVPQNFDVSRLFSITTDLTNASYEGDTLRYLAKYPAVPPVTAGRYLTVMAPAWTCPTSFTANDLLLPGDTGNRFADVVTNVTRAVTNLQSLHSSRVPILNYIAKTTYESCVLERTSAFITIPLCLKIQAGRTYTMASMDGSPLYQGFLRGVVHTIALGDTGGTATTTLDFSHIIVNGAELSGINVPSRTTKPAGDVTPQQLASVSNLA